MLTSLKTLTDGFQDKQRNPNTNDRRNRDNERMDIRAINREEAPRGHGRHRTGTTKIRYSEGSWNPSQFYIGTYFPEEKTTLLRMVGGGERCLAPIEDGEGGMDGQGGMEETKDDSKEDSAISQQDASEGELQNISRATGGPDTEIDLSSYDRSKWFSSNIPFDVNRPEINYFTGQWERGDGAADKLGKLHLQFFIEFRDKVRCPQARLYLCDTYGKSFKGWIEPARSSAAHDYVRKDRSRVGSVIEIGVRGGSNGKRGQLDQIFEFMQNGGSALEASTRWPFAFSRNVNSIKFWGSYYDKPRDANAEITVEIYWGVTGSGKSFKAFSENPTAYRKMQGKWWDGYRGEETVIFDEFKPCSADDWKTGSPTEIDLPYILRLCDRYPLMIEYKGGTMQMRATKFIFTSNFCPAEWWLGHHQLPAFCRRVTRVLHFPEKWEKDKETKIVEQKLVLQG